MEIIIRILITTIAATSAMTLFGYILSWSLNKCFKEPALLELVFESLFNIKNNTVKKLVAWVFHYFVGSLFVVSYEFIWAKTNLNPDWKSGLLYGFVCGLIAIISWSILLRIPKEIPKIDKKDYCAQLLIAHFIFAFTAVAVYRLM